MFGNQSQLQGLLRDDPLAASFFLCRIAVSERAAETSLDDVSRWATRNGRFFQHNDLVQAARRLENLGVGRFIIGRKGHVSRLQWASTFDQMGVTYDGNELFVSQNQPEDTEQVPNVSPSTIDKPTASLLSHTFRLRPNMTITFEIPENLDKGEADRLAAFIQTLPFGHE